jgi:hypothetical protein
MSLVYGKSSKIIEPWEERHLFGYTDTSASIFSNTLLG